MTPRTLTRLAWLAGLAFVAGLIVFLPARLIEGPINAALAPNLHLATTGTVWSGCGRLVSTRPGAFNIPLTWKFAPLSLFRLRAAWRVTADSPALAGAFTAGAGLQTFEFRDGRIDADISMFAKLNQAAEMFRPSGRVQFESEAFTVRYDNPLRIGGNAKLILHNLGLGSMTERLIGSYYIDLDGRDTTTTFVLTESFGLVALMGNGSNSAVAPRQFEFNGDARVANETPDPIKNLIAGLGKPGPDGRVRIERKVTW